MYFIITVSDDSTAFVVDGITPNLLSRWEEGYIDIYRVLNRVLNQLEIMVDHYSGEFSWKPVAKFKED